MRVERVACAPGHHHGQGQQQSSQTETATTHDDEEEAAAASFPTELTQLVSKVKLQKYATRWGADTLLANFEKYKDAVRPGSPGREIFRWAVDHNREVPDFFRAYDALREIFPPCTMVDIFAVIDPADVDRLLENARRRAGENLSLMFQHVLSPRHKRPFTTEARPYDYHRKVKPRAPEPNSAPFFQRLPPELVPVILAKLLPERDVTGGRMLLSVYIGRQLYLLDLVCRFFGWPLADGLSPTESLAKMACSEYFNVRPVLTMQLTMRLAGGW
ncbi:hypothetical protein PAPYR_4022 [Paratrimastix pyriformis]|uniref:Uncharacterized protein n=1 Tax=Paratrimastix pyriformis TaxID=342808 RepID=A0ABQ8UQX2_9EUKA|nr:hypothetical protein PAPYR_4022 [Paratrimastix pyriformis]